MNKRFFAGRYHGFTMVEALVTISIMAVLLAVTVPSALEWILLNRVKASAAEMVTDIQLARAETVRRNAQVRVAFRTNASQSCYTVHTSAVTGNCRCTDGAGVACAGGGGTINRHELKTASLPFSKGVNMSFAPNWVQFDPPSALPFALTTMQVNFDGGGTRKLRVFTNAAGRPQVCASAGSTVIGYAPCI